MSFLPTTGEFAHAGASPPCVVRGGSGASRLQPALCPGSSLSGCPVPGPQSRTLPPGPAPRGKFFTF